MVHAHTHKRTEIKPKKKNGRRKKSFFFFCSLLLSFSVYEVFFQSMLFFFFTCFCVYLGIEWLTCATHKSHQRSLTNPYNIKHCARTCTQFCVAGIHEPHTAAGGIFECVIYQRYQHCIIYMNGTYYISFHGYGAQCLYETIRCVLRCASFNSFRICIFSIFFVFFALHYFLVPDDWRAEYADVEFVHNKREPDESIRIADGLDVRL